MNWLTWFLLPAILAALAAGWFLLSLRPRAGGFDAAAAEHRRWRLEQNRLWKKLERRKRRPVTPPARATRRGR